MKVFLRLECSGQSIMSRHSAAALEVIYRYYGIRYRSSVPLAFLRDIQCQRDSQDPRCDDHGPARPQYLPKTPVDPLQLPFMDQRGQSMVEELTV